MGIPKLHRIIEVTGNCTFEDLHDKIFEAFERYDPHLYSFYLTKEDTKSKVKIWDSPEITNPQNTLSDVWDENKEKEFADEVKIEEANLQPKDVFYYWFDFGDNWWHRIRVQAAEDIIGNKKSIKVIKSVGEAPPQYPDYDGFE
jgi:hypothetical protein